MASVELLWLKLRSFAQRLNVLPERKVKYFRAFEVSKIGGSRQTKVKAVKDMQNCINSSHLLSLVRLGCLKAVFSAKPYS